MRMIRFRHRPAEVPLSGGRCGRLSDESTSRSANRAESRPLSCGLFHYAYGYSKATTGRGTLAVGRSRYRYVAPGRIT